MADRFIKLYEKMLQWGWYKNTNVKSLFIHLLLKANYKDLVFEGHKISRGQLVTSLPSLSSETGLSIRQIRVSLEHLIMTGEVASSSYPRYRVITVLNYDEYQSYGSLDGSQMTGETAVKRQADDRLMTVKRQADDRLMTASIEHIEHIESIEQTEQIEPTAQRDVWFDEFWEAYPKKLSKQDAQKAWKALKPNDEIFRRIMGGLQRWIASDQWQRENGQYIPYPATWIRKRRWEDELTQSAPPSAPKRELNAYKFEQRDYSTVPDDDMRSLADEMRLFKETGEVDM